MSRHIVYASAFAVHTQNKSLDFAGHAVWDDDERRMSVWLNELGYEDLIDRFNRERTSDYGRFVHVGDGYGIMRFLGDTVPTVTDVTEPERIDGLDLLRLPHDIPCVLQPDGTFFNDRPVWLVQRFVEEGVVETVYASDSYDTAIGRAAGDFLGTDEEFYRVVQAQ